VAGGARFRRTRAGRGAARTRTIKPGPGSVSGRSSSRAGPTGGASTCACSPLAVGTGGSVVEGPAGSVVVDTAAGAVVGSAGDAASDSACGVAVGCSTPGTSRVSAAAGGSAVESTSEGLDAVGAGPGVDTAPGEADEDGCERGVSGPAVVGGAAAVRGGRKRNGSRYPFSSAVNRTPRWTYGVGQSASPDRPVFPISAPSETAEPRFTAIEPRCTSVTEYPSLVSTVTLRPLVGVEPANEIVPALGASTCSPSSPAMSIPRC
jgi:hypothetical protein